MKMNQNYPGNFDLNTNEKEIYELLNNRINLYKKNGDENGKL